MQDVGRFEMEFFICHIISCRISDYTGEEMWKGGHCEALFHYLLKQCFARPQWTLITTKQYQHQDITNPCKKFFHVSSCSEK